MSIGRKLFIGGVSWDTSDEQFQEYFSQFGEIEDALVMRDRGDGKSRGFGFVTFKDSSSAQKVLSATGLELDGRKLDPKPAVPREQIWRSGKSEGETRTCKVFVGGLSPDTTKEEFQSYFSKFGKVVEAMIMLDRESGRPRGFGFVTFESEDAADKVVSFTSHSLNSKPVECKKAVPKSEAPPPIRASGGYGRGVPQVSYGAYYGQQSYGYGYDDQFAYDAYSGYGRGYGMTGYPRTYGDTYLGYGSGYGGYGGTSTTGSSGVEGTASTSSSSRSDGYTGVTTGYEQAFSSYGYGINTAYTSPYTYGTGYPGYESYTPTTTSPTLSSTRQVFTTPY